MRVLIKWVTFPIVCFKKHVDGVVMLAFYLRNRKILLIIYAPFIQSAFPKGDVLKILYAQLKSKEFILERR